MHANANVQKLKGNDDKLAKHERWLQEMRDEQQKIKGNELLVVKDLLMLQQHREERLKIVEQQSHNAEELNEQTSLLQELRKEIDKLRNEQKKIKDNERRGRDEKGNGEKIEPYVLKSADQIAFQEGYQHGASEAVVNWGIEREMAEPYSSASDADSVSRKCDSFI